MLLPETLTPEELLAEQLDVLSTAALKSIATNLRVQPAPNRRDALISALVERIGSPVHRTILGEHLGPEEWFILGSLRLSLGSVRLSSLLMTLHERDVRGKQAFETISRLISYGALLPIGPTAGPQKLSLNLADATYIAMYLSLLPAPNVEDWARQQGAGIELPAPTERPDAILGSALLDLQRTVFVVTAEAGHKPIKLTTTGSPYKAEITRMAKALVGAGVHTAQAKPTDPPPPLLWLALASAAALGLLQQAVEGLVPTDRVGEFFALPLEAQVANLYAAWSACVFNDFAFVPTLSTWYGHERDPMLRVASPYGSGVGMAAERMADARELICAGLERVTAAAPDAWFSIDDFARYIFQQAPDLLYSRVDEYELFYFHRYGYAAYERTQRRQYPGILRAAAPDVPEKERALFMDTDWREVEGAFIRQVLSGSLRWIGLVEVDRPPAGEEPTRFHLTDFGRRFLLGLPLPEAAAPTVTGRVVVQPNFDVIVVDATNNWGLLAQLDAFAERRTLDRAATYQLNQAALVRGLDLGWTGQRVIETLEASTGAPLPQNVLYTLREWATRYESLTVRERATLLEADGPEQLDRWLANPELAALLGRRLGPTTVLVPARHVDRVVGGFKQGALRAVDYTRPPTSVLEAHDPDLIEVLTPDVEPFLQYRLELLAERIERTADHEVYRLTSETVARARGAGWNGKALLDFLSLAARTPLPPDVTARVLGWSGAIPPLHAETLVGVVLTAERPSWAELRKIKPIGRLIRALPTPVLALVAPADLDRLRAELEARGLSLEEQAIADEVDVKERRAALRAALQAFDNPTQVLREMAAQGLIKLSSLYG